MSNKGTFDENYLVGFGGFIRQKITVPVSNGRAYLIIPRGWHSNWVQCDQPDATRVRITFFHQDEPRYDLPSYSFDPDPKSIVVEISKTGS